jgi:hypothetical protein
VNGLNYLRVVSNIVAGTRLDQFENIVAIDPRCPRGYGGSLTEFGLDSNLDTFLNPSEVIASATIIQCFNVPQ